MYSPSRDVGPGEYCSKGMVVCLFRTGASPIWFLCPGASSFYSVVKLDVCLVWWCQILMLLRCLSPPPSFMAFWRPWMVEDDVGMAAGAGVSSSIEVVRLWCTICCCYCCCCYCRRFSVGWWLLVLPVLCCLRNEVIIGDTLALYCWLEDRESELSWSTLRSK